MTRDCLTGKVRRSTELLLWVVAAVCFGVICVSAIAALSAHRRAEKIVPLNSIAVAGEAIHTVAESGKHSASSVIGRIEIPALDLSVPMTAGIETSSLLRGVGHIVGTAMPGGLGTLGLAGHRDTWLRPLRRITAGMDIRVMDATGTYHYNVDSTEIVAPDQVNVLAIGQRPELALITCYPFYYVGAAPKRFVVHAHLVSAAPDVNIRAGVGAGEQRGH